MPVVSMAVFTVMQEMYMNTRGYSAGLDFERKIYYQKMHRNCCVNLMHPKWDGTPIMLSGNTGLLSAGAIKIPG